eukprot:gene12837-16973_t
MGSSNACLRRVYLFVFGPWAWVSTDGGYFAECLGIIFETYKPRRHWWVLPEYGHLVILSFAPNWQTEVRWECTTRNAMVCLVFVISP